MTTRDWLAWHADYRDPASTLSRRLAVVQRRIREVLDGCPPGPIRVVSLCAGQGRDLVGALEGHPRRGDVTARLVELDPRNAAIARELAARAGLDRIEVLVADAALVDHYTDLVPAEVVLVCGVYGNIDDADVERTVEHCAQLCAAGGYVVWTRHRREPDLVPRICGWYESRGFERWWLSDPAAGFGVGVHRYRGVPRPLVAGARMFTFRG